jgi:hypothetical protein
VGSGEQTFCVFFPRSIAVTYHITTMLVPGSRREIGRVSEGAHLVVQVELLEQDRDLVTVGRARGVQVDISGGLVGHLEMCRDSRETTCH